MRNLENMSTGTTMENGRSFFSTFRLFTFSILLAATAASAALDSATLDGNTRTLYGGTVYTVAGNVTIAGAS